MGVFIEISVEERSVSSELARRLVGLCPVDIFALEGTRLVVQPDQEDECTLCELCLKIVPAKAITIRKTYVDESLVSRGDESGN